MRFWSGKRVLLTGHTGFKGSWMALILEQLGAQVTGLSLPPDTQPNLFSLLNLPLDSRLHDIRDTQATKATIARAQPDIVIHMAAQPLVRRSYAAPLETIETNIMGTAILLDALRNQPQLQAIIVVTSDKVYENREAGNAFTEDAPLGGNDPYSASKAGAEIITRSYAKSFFSIPVVTARAGNVIGGGDWSADRLVPDLWRAYAQQKQVELRHPEAVRPWQHVLEPLYGYLLYAQHIASGHEAPSSLNFGPPAGNECTVQTIAEECDRLLGAHVWKRGVADVTRKESGYLAIDPLLAEKTLAWRGLMTAHEALSLTLEWYKAHRDGHDMRAVTQQQIDDYLARTRVAVRAS